MNKEFESNNFEKKPLNEVEAYERGSWESVKEDIMNIENSAFKGSGFEEKVIRDIFEDEHNLNYLLKDSQNNKIIGYVSVEIRKGGESAHIVSTVILPKHQGKGNVGLLMQTMESEIKSMGVRYLTRNSAVDNGYADKIQKHYGNKIINEKTYEKMSEWGKQRHFEIEL